MTIAMSIRLGDYSYYTEFSPERVIVVSEFPEADLIVPGIRCKLTVRFTYPNATIQCQYGGSTQSFSGGIDKLTVLDKNRNFSAYFSSTDSTSQSMVLPYNGEVYVGRKDKRKTGEINDIVIPNSHISQRH